MTEFKNLVKETFSELFSSYGIVVEEESKNYVRFASKCVCIAFAYNVLEKSTTIFISKEDMDSYELTSEIAKEVFGDNSFLSGSRENILKEFSQFLRGKGEGILSCNPTIFQKIKHKVEEYAKMYTRQLLLEQKLREADQAWDKQNYPDYIKLIDEINDKIPISYLRKYRVAELKIADNR